MNKKLENTIDNHIGTIRLEISVPLYIDEILGKKEDEITEQEWEDWKTFIKDDFELWEQHHDIRLEHGSWEYNKIIESFKEEHYGGLK